MTLGIGRPREYPSWDDEAGRSRPFTSHMNWNCCREILRRLGDEAVVPEWRDHVAFTYGVAAVIGMQPSKRHRLETVESGQLFGPMTVLWWREPSKDIRLPVLGELRRRVRAGDRHAEVALGRLVRRERVDTHVRRLVAADQRRPLDSCPCTGIYVCLDHEAARQVD